MPESRPQVWSGAQVGLRAADEQGMFGLTVLLLMMFMVLVPAHLVSRALARPSSAPLPEPGGYDEAPVALPTGVRLEDYVHRGLADLRIMLIQSARRDDAA